MKKLLPFLVFAAMTGCGSEEVSFDGVWSGTSVDFRNECPFPVAENLDSLFPLTVSEDESGTFTVTASDGSVAVGRQGERELISFRATAPTFGDFGSIAPYQCTPLSSVGFLTAGGSEAKISVSILFDNCTLPGSTDDVDECSVIYRWDGIKSGA